MTIKKIKAIMNDNELNKLNHNFDYLSESHRRIQTQINDLVLDAGESNQEVAQARGGHQVLNDRLNSIDLQLAQKATREELYRESNSKADKSYVEYEVGKVNDRINDIITTPAESVSSQEIIDAREGKESLGDNVREIRNKTSIGLENRVKNGNFSSGDLFEFYTTFGEAKIVDGNAVLTGNSGRIGASLNQVLANEVPQNQIWYLKARVRSIDEGANWLALGIRASQGTSTSRINNPVAGQWYTFSHYLDDVSSLSGTFNASVFSYWPDATGKRIEVDYLIAVNLTDFYGRGKEPSKEQIDELLSNVSYFDGDLGSGRIVNHLMYDHDNFKESIKDLVSEVEKSTESKLENIVTNGDFKDNKDGWTSSTGTWSTASDGWLVIRGSGEHRVPRVYQQIQTDYEVGDVLYLTAYFRPENSDVEQVGFAVYSDLSSGDNISYLNFSDLTPNEAIKVSGNITIPSDVGDLRLQVRTSYPSAELSEGKEVRVTNIKAYNLTKFFGKGNEPSSDAFEKMLSVMPSSNTSNKPNIAETQHALTNYILSRSSSGSIKRPLAIVSFDDHWLSDYEKAFPFLEARGIKGTSYVITSQVGAPDKMDWHHLRELRKAGWNIGFHTHNHINLSVSTDEEIRQDFEMGIQTFLDNGFPKPRHFAYPYGAGTDSDRVRNVLADYFKTARNSRGYSAGVNNRYGQLDFLRLNGLSIDMNEHRQDRLEKIKNMMKYSAENNEIVFLYAHKLVDAGPTNDRIPETIFSQWAELIDYALDLDFEFVTQEEFYLRVLHDH